MASGIYKIEHRQSGRAYVGSAVNLQVRWWNHRSDLNRQRHCNIKLLRAWNKYGADAFEFSVVEFIPKEDLITREQFWIDKLEAATAGYNISPIAGNSLGRVDTPEVRAKKSAARKGRVVTPEERAKIAASLRGRQGTRLGAKTPDETRRKQSIAATGRKMSKESIEKAINSRTPEQRSAASHKAWATKRELETASGNA